jgi:hypothetical protein
MQTREVQLSADQIVEETSDWPEDAVADLVDRILRAKYGEADPSVDMAWQDEARRRIADMESGRVQGVALGETLAKARNHRPAHLTIDVTDEYLTGHCGQEQRWNVGY